MKLNVTFKENKQRLALNFGEVHNVSDGGYERGYAAGLAKREYEVWTITLTDGSIIEKEVALLW